MAEMKRRSFLKGLFVGIASVRLLGAQAVFRTEPLIEPAADFSKLGEVLAEHIRLRMLERSCARAALLPRVLPHE
jgi:hypothetical protein